MACKTARAKQDLVRIVRVTDTDVRIDPTGKANGRGAYLCRDASCWTIASSKGVLDRALDTRLPAELRATLAAGPDHEAALGTEPNERQTTHDLGGDDGTE